MSYGPTETTITATAATCMSNDSVISIGKPLPNYLVYILDSKLQPVPIGVPGDLYIGGAGLARGYLADPELTKSKFIPNPFLDLLKLNMEQKSVYGNRMYKTGDLCRWLATGNIDYIGRSDSQVKLRGLRIELGEIEAAILTFKGISNSFLLPFYLLNTFRRESNSCCSEARQ